MVPPSDRWHRRRALAAWLVVAACGSHDAPLFDAVAAPTLACDPVAQTGCMAGDKCTWLIDRDRDSTTDAVGHIGCSPAGPIADGATCTDAVAIRNRGADSCVAGDLCVSGRCKRICDPQLVEGAGGGACATSYACSTYANVFVSGRAAAAGVCDPTCEPLTQKLIVGAAAACGSPDPASPSETCVASTGFRSFHCAPTDPTLFSRVDRQPPLTDAQGGIYGNGCAPGFIPFYYEDASSAMTTLCSGMCAPLKVDATIAADPAHKDDNRGDRRALGKLPTDPAPVAGRSTCAPAAKGSAVSAPHGEDCRFVWFSLAMGDPTRPLQSPFNDTLGICFAYEKFLSITVPGMAQKQPEKSCAELPAVAPSNDPYGSAKANGCYPLGESLGLRAAAHRAPPYRLAHGDGIALRHVFD